MVAVHIKAFRGQVPRISDRLLQGNQATQALNCKLTSGRLDPLKGLGLAHTSLASAIQTIYRYRHFNDGVPLDYWLTWAGDVDVVPSPLANDEQGRVYFSGADFEPRMSTYALATQGSGPYPAQWYALGLPLPIQAPGLSATGGTAPSESRAYVYTFVTALGEESGPSPASAVTSGNTNGSWSLSSLQAAPPNSGSVTAVANNTPVGGQVRLTLDSVFGLRQHDTLTLSGATGMTALNGSHRLLSVDSAAATVVIALQTSQTYTGGAAWARNAPHNTTSMKKRIYRTAGTDGNFMYVDEIPVSQTTYSDTVAATALGESLPTLDALPPPANLSCLIALPNGCLAGIAGNELCFSDPYLPYSWPLRNRYAFGGRGVALTAAATSVLVLTDGFPILFSGTDPETMSPSTLETYAPCVSKRGTVNVGGGALYPSQDGLWLASPSGVRNLTQRLYRVDEWSRLNPSSFVAAFRDGQYYGAHDDGVDARVWVLDMAEPDSVIEVDERADAMCRNPFDGKLYLAKGNKIYEWDADAGTPYFSVWRSATTQLGRPTNFAVAQIHADFPYEIPLSQSQVDANMALMADATGPGGYLDGNELLATEINGSLLMQATPDSQKKVQFTLIKDGLPVYAKAVTSSTPFRLPASFRSEIYNVVLNAAVATYSVTMAESMAELAQASA